MRVRWFHKIQFKLFLVMALFLSLTVLTISLQSLKTYEDVIYQNIKENAVEVAKQNAQSVENMFEVWSSIIHLMAHNFAAQNMKELQNEANAFFSSNRDLVALSATLANLKKTTPLLSMFKSRDPTRQQALSRKIAFKKMEKKKLLEMKKKYNVYQVRKISFAGKSYIVVDFVFTSRQDKQSYIVFSLTANVLSLQRKLSSHKMTNSTLIQKNGAKVTGMTHFPSYNLKENIRQIVRIPTDTGYLSDDKDFLYVYHKLRSIPLTIVINYKDASQAQKISWAVRKGALFSGIIGVFTILFSYFVAKGFTFRIQKTIVATSQIANGNLGLTLRDNHKDEISLLAYSVNKLSRDLKNYLQFRLRAAQKEQELKTAKAVQENLIPEKIYQNQVIKCFSHYQAAEECAGDWWGIFELDPSRSLVVVGDVTGHGASSALIASIAYSFFQTTLSTRPHIASPSHILSLLNEVLFNSGRGKHTMTMSVFIVDKKKKELQFSNAGHVASYYSVEGKLKPLMLSGSILGLDREGKFKDKAIGINHLGKLIVYTDGIVECENREGETLSGRKFKKVLSEGVHEPLESYFVRLDKTLRGFFEGVAFDDDITLAVCEFQLDNDTSQ